MIKFLDLKAVTALHGVEINDAVKRVVDSGWYLQGAENHRFERLYGQYIGTPYVVGCGNGLDALTLIWRAYIELEIMQPGDEVIVPANTFIASILSITEAGLKPVLVEPNYRTLLMDDSLIEQAITKKTKAILIVHLYGRCAYTSHIGELCKKYHLKLVEDNAQAHGCKFENKRTGSLGEAAAHSFYPGKNLGALGDAGAVTTHNSMLADVVRTLGNYGSRQKYVFDYQGKNSRMDEIQAAVLSVKLKYLDEDNLHRQTIAHYYYDHISNPLIQLPARLDDANNVYHLFPVLCEKRDDLQDFLRLNGVQTLIHYPIPPHAQACYQDLRNLSFPITDKIHHDELSLPISPVLTLSEAERIVNLINEFQDR